MRIFFYMKGLEIATALLLVGFVLTTWSLCGKREKGDILHEHCPLIFDHVEDLNSPDAVDRFFDRLRSNATEAPTRNRAARSVAKTINGQKNAEAEADENAEFPDEVLETAEFDTKIGPIAYMVLKIQHTFGESMTCCDIGPRNIACFPSDPSSPMTCRKLSPIMIPVLLWITCALFNAAHIVKILSNPMPPNAISVIWLLSLITSVWDRCNSWSWLQSIGGVLCIFNLTLHIPAAGPSISSAPWPTSSCGLALQLFSPTCTLPGRIPGQKFLFRPTSLLTGLWLRYHKILFHANKIVQVFSWMAVVSAVLQIRLHDKLYFNVQLKAPPHSFGDYKRTHELLPYATRN
ncbi:hypothetical protein L596_008120 [Steinernema carpocapsae]|uniref:Uncharacterized protein n=1 Tax=Steinernema carpocapsae TaxID=34508 RepID=A0A4U5PBZ8_STECR|nr:hypothetical protein L596_008120 [Steinernema carpocapsae]